MAPRELGIAAQPSGAGRRAADEELRLGTMHPPAASPVVTRSIRGAIGVQHKPRQRRERAATSLPRLVTGARATAAMYL
jgi:hypothetical protein